ncbi:unknown [Candidatus Apopatosoma intestinale]|nr:unknown [Candidatus Apopatosoma intestinale]
MFVYKLHSVADAEYRLAELKNISVIFRRARAPYAGGTAAQDDGIIALQLFNISAERKYIGIYSRFSYFSVDNFGILTAAIKYGYFFVHFSISLSKNIV